MTREFDRDPLVQALRESLAQHAQQAPSGDALADRVVRAVERPPAGSPSPRRSWRAWALPLVAAGAVAGVVAALVGIESYHPQASGPAGSPAPSITSTQHVSPAPSTAARTGASSTAPAVPDLTGVRIVDLTFTGDNSGWALASADCENGSGRCTALLRTTDGTHWRSMPGAAFNVPGVRSCAAPCVTDLRFANDSVGYAFGLHAFFLTTDGGQSWEQQPGGAIALETLDNNVIRVTASHSGCPSWCDVAVQTSPLASAQWTPAPLANAPGFGVQLSRGGSAAYLLFPGHPAGGAQDARSLLYRSTDDGRHWSAVGEPCPQGPGEVDSYAVAAGTDGRAAVLCATRQAPQRWFVATSTDAGLHFTAQPGAVPAPTATLLTGDPATVLVTAGDGMARSTDGGRTWQPVAGVTGQIGFVGFESPQVGRAVSADGRTVWTTRDAGRGWSAVTFG